MKKVASILICALTLLSASAQPPEWAEMTRRQQLWPKEKYYVGYASLRFDRNDDIATCTRNVEADAKAVLVESIRVTVKSQTKNYVTEKMTTGKRNQLASDFVSIIEAESSSYSFISLDDLQPPETTVDQKGRAVYALFYLDKAKMKTKYQTAIDKYLFELQNIQSQASLNAEKERQINALQKLGEANPVYNQIDDAQRMVFTIAGDFYRIDDYYDIRNQIVNLNDNISNSKTLDLETTCDLMVRDLKLKTGSNFRHIMILNHFTYENTVYSSALSSRIMSEIGTHLVNNGYNMGKKLTDEIRNAGYVEITGNYFVQGNSIKIFMNLEAKSTGKSMAGVIGYISKDWVEQNNIQFVPDAIQRTENRRENIVPMTTNAATDFIVQTDINPLEREFTDGDLLRLFVKAIRPGYLRILYFQADGDVALLCDNFLIDKVKAGKWIDLEKERVFILGIDTKTYGEEDLVVQFAEDKFSELPVRGEWRTVNEKQQYVEIIDTDYTLRSISETTKAYNALQKEKPPEEVPFLSQTRIPIKVVPKKK